MIRIPNESRKGLEDLLAVKDRLESFQNGNELNTYLSNINRKSIKNRNLDVIFSNLRNNMIFKYSDKGIKQNVKELLFLAEAHKVLSKGEVFKLYLYLYENEQEEKYVQEAIEKYSKDNIEVTKESFIEFMIKEAKNIYSVWEFPTEIKVEYQIFKDVVKKLEDPEVFKKLSSIMLELGRYIDMDILTKDLRDAVKKEMLLGLPLEARRFFEKYNRVKFKKVEKIDNIIFIFLNGKNVVSLTIRENRKLKISLIDRSRYSEIIKNEISTVEKREKFKNFGYELKTFKELAKKLRDYGYDIKWIEIDKIPKVIGIVSVLISLIAGMSSFIYYKYFKEEAVIAKKPIIQVISSEDSNIDIIYKKREGFETR